MYPSWGQIEQAAYDRFQRRGWLHGHDQEDWLGAERDLTFGLNYTVLARHKLTGTPTTLPAERMPRCRFCERSDEEVSFSEHALLVPESFTACEVFTPSECDECREQFRTSLDGDLKRFLDAMLEIRREADEHGFRGVSSIARNEQRLSVGALKSLSRVALLLMPESQLGYFGDTIEWVGNPEHERDAGSLDSLFAWVYFPHVPLQASMVSLARKTYEDTPFPYAVLFLGTPEVMIQVPVPYCVRDDDRDGELEPMPRLSLACGHGHDFRDSLCLSIPVERGGSGRTGRYSGSLARE